jgi:type II restriction enzyme
MRLNFNKQLSTKYKNLSQKVRVLTEQWLSDWIFCPSCGQQKIYKYPNNKPVADFFRPSCREEYELKSKQGSIGTKLLDGEYQTKIKRLRSTTNPNLFVLNYNLKSLSVVNLFVIPKYFFIPEVIEKRKPLSSTARRSGWIGSNILLQKVPQAGKIFLIRQGKFEQKEKVLAGWRKTLFLLEEKEISQRGWLLDVMRCVEKIGKCKFSLQDIYRFEDELSIIHPNNKHIKDKIRQQLQVLRDKNYLDFVSRGYYRMT